MGDQRKQLDSEGMSGAGDVPAAPRLPYRAPSLRHLGSVRELTLGGTPVGIETGGTRGRFTKGG